MNDNIYIPNFKSIFKDELFDFIMFKRSNGYKYGRRKCYNFIRLDTFFIHYKLDEKKITNECIDEWLKQFSSLSINTKQLYYGVIHMFTEYLVCRNYTNITIPSINYFNGKSGFVPYIYTKKELKDIFNESKNNDTLYMTLHLLYHCGLRISEVGNLKLSDFNIFNKTIIIRHSKNDVTRLIPLTDAITSMLQNYIGSKNLNQNDYIFECKNKRQTFQLKTRDNFHKVLEKTQIKKRENNKWPRLHDLRHTFAVHALEQMQDKGFDLYTSLPSLSIYLGHKSIVETEYYLRFTSSYSNKVLTSNEYIDDLYIEKETYKNE